MGGKKRLSLSQMEKMQARRQRRNEGGVSKSGAYTNKKAGVLLPNTKRKEIVDELKKMKVLTPYAVASRFELRLSVAKNLLKSLEKQGTIEFVSSGKNLKIYKII